jgi:hypothetical protein
MTAPNIIKIPCEVEGFCLARNVLRNPDATAEQITAACDVLAASNDWFDIRMVRNARNVLWSLPGSEILPEDIAPAFSQRIDAFPELDEVSYDLRFLLIGASVMITAGLGIGYLLQMLWGAV